MCGIAALIGVKDSHAGHLHAMATLVAHRGPDGEGFALGDSDKVRFYHGEVDYSAGTAAFHHFPSQSIPHDSTAWSWGLAHRRLGIIDLSPSGHQPMATPDLRCVITYNGEIYNYLELRQELEQAGYCFFSATDTEVVLAAYAHWGIDCLHHFNGMFAFILVDRKQQTVLVARDRFGIKPLYYYRLRGGIAFASEIKQFSVLPGWKPEIDWQAAHDFLLGGLTDHDTSTLFSGTQQLQGGCYLQVTLGQIPDAQPKRWYDLSQRIVQRENHFEEAALCFATQFADAVKLCLRADVPVGTALSGGLDSSSIVCEASAQLHQAGKAGQKSFSICSPIREYDERQFMDIVTVASKTEAHYHYPDSDTLLQVLPDLVWYQEEPFAGTSIFAEWEVYKLAKACGVKVTLDGHGADEMLCGYHLFFWIHLNELLMQGRIDQWYTEVRALKQVHGYGLAEIIRTQLLMILPSQWVRPIRNLARNEQAHAHLLACPAADLRFNNDPQERLRSRLNNVRSESILQLTQTSVPVQLHWADRNSMAHSVESRLPFLDYRLVEQVVFSESSHKLSGGVTKRLLRSGMSPRLPSKIVSRQDKLGFVTPEQIWLCEQQGKVLSTWLEQRRDYAVSLVSPDSLQRAIRIFSQEERFNLFAWRVLSMVLWGERFAVQGK